MACAEVTDNGARLACFDKEAHRRRAAAREASAAQLKPDLITQPAAVGRSAGVGSEPKAAPDDTIGLDGRQLAIRREKEGIQPPAAKPFTATLIRLTVRPDHQYYFELDNGQVWESTDTAPDLFLGPREPVIIRPGVLGAFFLKTQEGNSIRVHRLR